MEDVLEFVPRVQRDHMQKEHNTEQTTLIAPFKKEAGNECLTVYINTQTQVHSQTQIHIFPRYLVSFLYCISMVALLYRILHLCKISTSLPLLSADTSSVLRSPKTVTIQYLHQNQSAAKMSAKNLSHVK